METISQEYIEELKVRYRRELNDTASVFNRIKQEELVLTEEREALKQRLEYINRRLTYISSPFTGEKDKAKVALEKIERMNVLINSVRPIWFTLPTKPIDLFFFKMGRTRIYFQTLDFKVIYYSKVTGMSKEGKDYGFLDVSKTIEAIEIHSKNNGNNKGL